MTVVSRLSQGRKFGPVPQIAFFYFAVKYAHFEETPEQAKLGGTLNSLTLLNSKC